MKTITTLLIALFFANINNAQSVISVVPSSGTAGQELTVSLSGDNGIFYLASTTENISFTNQFSNFLPISQIEYLDSENLLVTINIPSDANLGDYNVNVFNTSLGLYSSIPFGFRVNNSLNTLDYLKPVVLSVSPNPAKQYLDLILNEDLAQNAKCEIFDTSGKVVFNYKLKSKTTNINIEKLVKGNYILKVTNGTKRITKKIIKN